MQKVARKTGPALPATHPVRGNPPAAAWPNAATGTLILPATDPIGTAPHTGSDLAPQVNPGQRSASGTIGGLPVSIITSGTAAKSTAAQPPNTVRLQVLDQSASRKANVQGVIIKVSAGSSVGPLDLSIDYSAFATAYGADWANRLTVMRLPVCALTTPGRTTCHATPIPTSNNATITTVTARATPAAFGTVYALAATPSSGVGDYSATPLKASSSWSGGGSSGDFDWSYPMRVPPTQGGPTPTVALSYSSQSVDGETAANNNQPSQIGEGFDYSPGSISRRYKACSDDMKNGGNNTTQTGDECWGTDNAILSLNGQSTELVKDDSTGAWRLRNDDGSKVEHLTGETNGDNDGEYWKVTTTDGTQYWFGLNHLPGWTTGKPTTNSTWNVPVYGNNDGESCHATDYANSWCQQAWQWNLDYVVDPHGNSMSYWYTAETNNYGRNLTASAATSYTRGGYLSRIDYGTRTSAEFGTAPQQVVLQYADRCAPGTTCDAAHPASWPDTPWDQSCTTSTCADTQLSPTFWSSKMLSTITTQVWTGTGTTYRQVDQWTLAHDFLDPGDNTRAGLWLSSITHTGLVGGSASMPAVTFTGVHMSNRVDTIGDGAPAMNWYRIGRIVTETGEWISVTYSPQDCIPGTRMPSVADTNTLRCFPVYYTKPGATDPTLNWFHKYVVTTVDERDTTGGTPDVITSYAYPNPPAWHFDDQDGLVPASHKTWGQWRGYDQVITTLGDPSSTTDHPSQTDTRYLRGMDGDKLSDGSHRSVTAHDDEGNPVTDSDAFAGMTLETITNNGPNGPVVTATANTPWQSAPTASRLLDGITVTARYTGTAIQRTRTALDGGRGWRRTETDTTYDTDGMPTAVNDLGDTSTPTDDECTRTTYVRNTTLWIRTTVSNTEVDALSCDKTPTSQDQIIREQRTSYDGAAWGTAPTKGDPTQIDTGGSWTQAAGFIYVTTSRSKYDTDGRLTDSWDALNNHSTTAYTPATGGPVTQVVTTNAAGYATTATVDPAWGSTTQSVDANNKTTSISYDPLGRLTSVWLPTRTKGTNSANITYAYNVSDTQASSVTTSTLNTALDYVTTYTLYDALLRQRQTQATSPQGGRIVTDTTYNTLGQQASVNGPYWTSTAPTTQLDTSKSLTDIDTQTQTVYDGANRAVASIFTPYGKEKWRTTTAYGGDHADVTPPAGGTPTSTYTDARGNTTQLLQYHGSTVGGDHDTTTYTHTPDGKLTSITDPAGNQWTYAYDLRGRRINATDPDTGTTTSSYDDDNNLSTATDARGVTLAYTYDALNRKTGEYLGSTTGTQLTSWLYDTLAKGQVTSSTRYDNGNAYTTAVYAYNNLYQAMGSVTTLPASEGKLAGTYTSIDTYNINGEPAAHTYPAAGGLPRETINFGYNALDLPTTVNSSLTATPTYVTGTDYDYTGPIQAFGLSTDKTHYVYQQFQYEPDTQRLSNVQTTRSGTAPNTIADTTYTYDPAGNLLKETNSQNAAMAGDTQCFTYDYLQRLTNAWTPADTTNDCATPPTGESQIGGSAPYWRSWGYDTTGNRTTTIDHTATTTTTTNSTYPAAGTPQPHTLASTTTTTTALDGSTTSSQNTYQYDPAGNTLSRSADGTSQTLSWNPDGHLASASKPAPGGGTTSDTYLYDADGTLLLQHSPDGTTAYLPGTELHLDATTQAVTATRFYSYNSTDIATRTANGVTFTIADTHNTGQISIDAATQATTLRYTDPFGVPRGPSTSWPNDHGYVGGTLQPDTGLTILGARQYDPTTGRFISPDSLLTPTDPQQLNGYAYSDNDPTTKSDPTGKMFAGDNGIGYGQIKQIDQANGVYARQLPDLEIVNNPSDAQVPGENATQQAKDRFGGYWYAKVLNKVATWLAENGWANKQTTVEVTEIQYEDGSERVVAFSNNAPLPTNLEKIFDKMGVPVYALTKSPQDQAHAERAAAVYVEKYDESKASDPKAVREMPASEKVATVRSMVGNNPSCSDDCAELGSFVTDTGWQSKNDPDPTYGVVNGHTLSKSVIEPMRRTSEGELRTPMETAAQDIVIWGEPPGGNAGANGEDEY